MAKRKRTEANPEIESQNDFIEPESGSANRNKKISVRREGGKVIVSVPVRFYRRNGRQMILAEGEASNSIEPTKPPVSTALVTNLAKAWQWQGQLESGEFGSVDEIAKANKVDRTHISRILQLTSLSPTIVERILAGYEPEGLSLRQLRKGIPAIWQEQNGLFRSCGS